MFSIAFTPELNIYIENTFMKNFLFQWVVEVWADQTAGGVWKSLCIKIGYSEPIRAESQEGTSTRAESSRVT